MNSVKTYLNTALLVVSIYFLTPFFVVRADTSTCPAGTICNPIPSISTLNDLLRNILQGVIKIGIPVIALAIIYSGFLLVTARGNSEKLKEAKKALLYTVIGAAILLGSWAISLMIQQTVSSL